MRSFRLLDEPRSISYSIILGVWGFTTIYAALHDQYIVQIAPEHFTIYHKPLWNIQSPELLALAYAFKASLGPGLVLGIACAFSARYGPLPKVSPLFILTGTIGVIVCAEILSVITGFWVHLNKDTFYPASWYPDQSQPMLITATIQFSCYLSGVLFSPIFLLIIILKRIRAYPPIPNAS